MVTGYSALHAPFRAITAGSTGLIGSALLPLLLADPHCTQVHALVRRAPSGAPTHPKLTVLTAAFDQLPPLPASDHVYITLGTTIKAAGSEAAFRQVDFDAVVNVARAAREAGATRLGLVSALGANPRSRSFYNRVKGETEEALCTLGYTSVVIAQPSLLLGDRSQLGQPARHAEAWAERLLRPVSRWLPRSIRPIEAAAVARALFQAMQGAAPGVQRLSSGEMQSAGP